MDDFTCPNSMLSEICYPSPQFYTYSVLVSPYYYSYIIIIIVIIIIIIIIIIVIIVVVVVIVVTKIWVQGHSKLGDTQITGVIQGRLMAGTISSPLNLSLSQQENTQTLGAARFKLSARFI